MSGDRIAIACSGGPDSLAALFSLTALARGASVALLKATYFVFVKRLCKDHNGRFPLLDSPSIVT